MILKIAEAYFRSRCDTQEVHGIELNFGLGIFAGKKSSVFHHGTVYSGCSLFTGTALPHRNIPLDETNPRDAVFRGVALILYRL